jgi:hypothetical protein
MACDVTFIRIDHASFNLFTIVGGGTQVPPHPLLGGISQFTYETPSVVTTGIAQYHRRIMQINSRMQIIVLYIV